MRRDVDPFSAGAVFSCSGAEAAAILAGGAAAQEAKAPQAIGSEAIALNKRKTKRVRNEDCGMFSDMEKVYNLIR